jgi:hypothetical protein
LENLRFRTIETLAQKFVDFLVLIPTNMDAQRNVHNYVQLGNTKVEYFLNSRSWRENWKSAESEGQSFGAFITNQFGVKMQSLGYHYGGLQDTVQIRLQPKNVPLYRLAFFSRNDLGVKFWMESLERTSQQLRLFD